MKEPPDIKNHASDDATLDGTGALFQAFKTRLKELAGTVTDNHAPNTVAKFRAWSAQTSEKFTEMAGDIPANSDVFISNLDTKTMANLVTADAIHSTKIIHLEKEAHRYQARFPELETNLGEPQQKNAFLLGGLVLFLVAVESIANSRFFAAGSEFGQLGGTLEAITVSLGNVCIPLGLAFIGHRCFYRYDSWRNFGIIMIGLFLLWTFGFNYLVVQYREILVVASGTGSSDSSTLNDVLLFALGAMFAALSFWKMWSFLDPFKQARKCLNSLGRTKEEYQKAVCADLREAEDRCNKISTEINQMDISIPGKFQRTEAEFKLLHHEIIVDTNKWFAAYHAPYCVIKVAPDPVLPVVTQENAREYNVGITDAEWDFFREMGTLLDGQINNAINEYVPRLNDILQRINDLIRRFTAVLTAKLLEWTEQGHMT